MEIATVGEHEEYAIGALLRWCLAGLPGACRVSSLATVSRVAMNEALRAGCLSSKSSIRGIQVPDIGCEESG